MERERGGDIEHLIHIRLRGLRETASGIGGQSLEIPAGTFHAKRERRLPGPRDTGDPGDLPERNINIDIFEVMDAGSPHLNMIRGSLGHRCV